MYLISISFTHLGAKEHSLFNHESALRSTYAGAIKCDMTDNYT